VVDRLRLWPRPGSRAGSSWCSTGRGRWWVTAADLTFGALSAPMMLPGAYGSPLPPLQAMPDAAARHISRLRSHPAGVFADRLYHEERWARRNGT
jgi:hypothetical protein